jgi:hypothetical protein
MGRRRTTVALGPTIVRLMVAGMALAPVLLGCGPDGSAERPYEPQLPTPDLRPKLVLVVDDAGVRAEPGERADPAVRTEPPTVPSGSVVTVRNGGTRDHRLRGDTSFDTGIMRAGEDTIVVLTNGGTGAQDLALVEVIDDRTVGRLTVEPDPAIVAGGT